MTGAAIVGSGPNGLAAAIVLAREGIEVEVFERNDTFGGGCRTDALTLPGFSHDICSAIHPLGVGSPFFKSLDLKQHGLHWVYPQIELAHPLDDGTAVVVKRSVEETAAALGRDEKAYLRMMKPLARNASRLMDEVLRPPRVPRHPLVMAAFGALAVRSVTGLAAAMFETDRARALLAGVGAHSVLPLDRSPTAAYALTLLILAHHVGWPMPKGGSQKITEALLAQLASLGGQAHAGRSIESLGELSRFSAKLFDVAPMNLARIAGNAFPDVYRRRLTGYRHGPGVFKMDFALSGPIPWKAPECALAGTVHVGGTIDEIALSEEQAWNGISPDKPFLILAQPSLFDDTRAPSGRHVAWAYCHVPAGDDFDMSARITDQIERFAPGFRDLILGEHAMAPSDIEARNPNYIGGDISGGVQDWGQLFNRPAGFIDPYATPAPDIFICSSSTPPGGGVHGMCGYFAARSALKSESIKPR
ncbi:MAG: NAD(P)/FAD-dependent oxidoreductase [Actinobacteria bacterium]|nr:NAD(P)/FAD-dependent oxidoreductase [Actinomycetota bacterium]